MMPGPAFVASSKPIAISHSDDESYRYEPSGYLEDSSTCYMYMVRRTYNLLGSLGRQHRSGMSSFSLQAYAPWSKQAEVKQIDLEGVFQSQGGFARVSARSVGMFMWPLSPGETG